MVAKQRFSAFLWATAIVVTLNVLVANGWALPWSTGETAFLNLVDNRGETAFTPVRITRALVGDSTPLFPVRLPGVILLGIALAGLLALGAPLFGRRYTLLGAALLGSSWLLPFLGKVANTDIWVFAAHAPGILFLLRFLKRPGPGWRWGFYGALLLGLLSNPISTLILFSAAPLLLYVLHPQGKRLAGLQPWGVLLGLTVALHFTGWLAWSPPGSFLWFLPGKYLLAIALGFFPFLPWVASGLWEALVRARRREELSIVFLSLLAAGLVALSPAVHLVLALVAGRQLEVYFQRGYPYRDLVRAVAIIDLILSFFLVTLLLLLGFGQYGGEGFRALMGPGAVLWMLQFVVVLGLYGMNTGQVKGGVIAAGFLPFLLFWLTAYPLWHQQRLWPERVASSLEQQGYRPGDPIFMAASPDHREQFIWTAEQEVRSLAPGEDPLRSNGGLGAAAVVADTSLWNPLEGWEGWEAVSGRDDRFRPVHFRVRVIGPGR